MVQGLEDMKTWVASLFLVVLTIAAVVVGLDAFQSGLIDDIPTTAVANESLTLDNVSGTGLLNNYVINIVEVLVTNASNATGPNRTLSTGEYTVTSLDSVLAPTITLTNESHQGNTSWVSYNYRDEYGSVQTNATNEGLRGASNASDYFDVIGTLVGVGALIGVVMVAFWFARR